MSREGEKNERTITMTITHADQQKNAGAIEHTTDPDPEVLEHSRGPRHFSPACKARIVAE